MYIIDNESEDRSVRKYLSEWCDISKQMDIAVGYWEIGGNLILDGDWQKLDKILDAVSFTDRIIFGRTNYSKEVNAFPDQKDFYNQCANRVIEFCTEHGIDYHIKDGTLTKLNED